MQWLVGCLSLLTSLTIAMESAIAQVVSDGSLSNPTNVITSAASYTVAGGSELGGNLFHSFSQFSVPTSRAVRFENAATIENIFSRVTGGTVSNVDGLVSTQNPANLFLLNPSGIVFGPNASLDIGGSFVASTADSLSFADGAQFSAIAPNRIPLLTISAPTGLHMGTSTGSILVNGANLQVQAGSAIALIGNGIQIDNGTLTAESGQIELGSIRSSLRNGQGSTVVLDTNPDPNTASEPWRFDYSTDIALADIYLTNSTQIDASGSPGGSIQIYGNRLQIQDGSTVFVQHQGTENTTRSIQINVDSLDLKATLASLEAGKILSENLSQGEGTNIEVLARQITGQNGGSINATTAQNGGRGGNITVEAAESIQIFGYSPSVATDTSGFNTPSSRGGGRGGDIFVRSPEILLQEGAGIGSLVFGGAGGGGLYLYSDTLSILGENAGTGGASFIAATTFFGGDAGIIDIRTGRLRLQGGGLISASTSASGNAGSLTIQADESIEIEGAGSVVSQPSRITASGQNPPGQFQQIFGLPPLPSGDAGDLSIVSPLIRVSNRGYIAAENVGSGDAGQLVIEADSIFLDQQGQIRAATAVGEGGNLVLNVEEALLLRHRSVISAEAGGSGDGGNIIINAPVVIGLENSDLVANAVQGTGGNIHIETQGIFGLAFRDQLTPENDITASSRFGVNGTVEINDFSLDPNSGLIELPETVSDSSDQIAQGCNPGNKNVFIATGRGGLPANPMELREGTQSWTDIRDLSSRSTNLSPAADTERESAHIIEATGWQTNLDGQVELAATSDRQQPLVQYATCAPSSLTS